MIFIFDFLYNIVTALIRSPSPNRMELWLWLWLRPSVKVPLKKDGGISFLRFVPAPKEHSNNFIIHYKQSNVYFGFMVPVLEMRNS
jgi:hypothetical protein